MTRPIFGNATKVLMLDWIAAKTLLVADGLRSLK
jgi:hypothetical protein